MLAAVVPPAVDPHDVQLPTRGVGAVDVGDLELAATGGLERVDDLEDVGRVAVEPDHRVARRRLRVAGVDDAGLLDDVLHRPVLAVGDDAEADRVVDLGDEDEGAVASTPRIASACAFSKMLSPRQTTSFSPRAKSRAIPTTCAIPPGSTCTL